MTIPSPLVGRNRLPHRLSLRHPDRLDRAGAEREKGLGLASPAYLVDSGAVCCRIVPGRSVRTFVTKRCPSDTRSTSMAIASTACSRRSKPRRQRILRACGCNRPHAAPDPPRDRDRDRHHHGKDERERQSHDAGPDPGRRRWRLLAESPGGPACQSVRLPRRQLRPRRSPDPFRSERSDCRAAPSSAPRRSRQSRRTSALIWRWRMSLRPEPGQLLRVVDDLLLENGHRRDLAGSGAPGQPVRRARQASARSSPGWGLVSA